MQSCAIATETTSAIVLLMYLLGLESGFFAVFGAFSGVDLVLSMIFAANITPTKPAAVTASQKIDSNLRLANMAWRCSKAGFACMRLATLPPRNAHTERPAGTAKTPISRLYG